jgi:hypothetical protein
MSNCVAESISPKRPQGHDETDDTESTWDALIAQAGQLVELPTWRDTVTVETLGACSALLGCELRDALSIKAHPDDVGRLVAEILLIGFQTAQLAGVDLRASFEAELGKRLTATSPRLRLAAAAPA